MRTWIIAAVVLAVLILGLGAAFNISRGKWFAQRDTLLEQVAAEKARSAVAVAAADSQRAANVVLATDNRRLRIANATRRAALPAVTPDTCLPYLALADSTQAEADGWHTAYDREVEASGKLRDAYTLAAGSRDSVVALLKKAPGRCTILGIPCPVIGVGWSLDATGHTGPAVAVIIPLWGGR